MLRVLLVLDDYAELMFLQTVMKKIGFDVDAIQNPRKFKDSLLQMNPDLLVLSALGPRVKGLELCRNLRRVRGIPRVILLRPAGSTFEENKMVDGWLDSPVSALALLHKMADLCSLNKPVLLEKFNKLQLKEIEEKIRVLRPGEGAGLVLEARGDEGAFGNLKGSSISSPERQERYKKFLEEQPPKEVKFIAKDIAEQVRKLREQESAEDLAELERQRKAFVEQLFKKKA